MNKYMFKQSGITLVELLATIAISSIFITLILSILTTTLNQNDKTLSHINLRQEANLIITEMRNKHQAGVTYNLCKNSLLPNSLVNFDNFILFNTANTNCKNNIDPKINMPVKFTLADNDNNKYEIDTIIEGIKGTTASNPTKVEVPTATTDSFYDYLVSGNIGIYGKKYIFSGDSTNGNGGKMVILGDVYSDDLNGGSMSNVSNIEIDGLVDLNNGSAGLGSKISPGTIIINGPLTAWGGTRQINGDVYVNGNFRIKDAIINGKVYVDGNVTVGWTPQFIGDSIVYYSGTISFPGGMGTNLTSKFVHVNTIPKKKISEPVEPNLKPKVWFDNNGYSSSNKLENNMKLFVENYYWHGSHTSVSNIVIVSNSDINLTGIGGSTIKGFLYAPNGKITFNGDKFEGVIISKNGVFITSGGTDVILKTIKDFFPTKESAPFH